ncbi:MAG: IS256 family transposase [Flavobacteriaceae bacterium]|nr:IS256 family transposase [Flavobacteriaceae bacterium]
MEIKDGKLPKDFTKEFQTKESFHSYFEDLYKQGIQHFLQAELDEHLGYQKHKVEGYNSGNSRNGSFDKTIKSETFGDIVLSIPRDRNGKFEPQIIPKGETMSQKIEEAILGMYARGMTRSDIVEQVKSVYGISVSESTISTISDKILIDVEEWTKRALDAQYLIVWMDAVHLKVRSEGKYINQAMHVVIGLRADGMKEVLGMWLNKVESASFWMTVLSDLKSRGVEDIIIACTDNLTGFTKAIKGVYPETITQLCIVHQIRNSMKFVVTKDLREFCKDLKNIYTSNNEEQAVEALKLLKSKWVEKYKYAIDSWERNWENLMPFLEYPPELRKIMYTTNTIENLNRGIRKYTKTKVQFPDERSVKKSVYLAILNNEKSWKTPILKWGLIMNQFLVIFGQRCRIEH